MPIGDWSTAVSPRRSVSALEKMEVLTVAMWRRRKDASGSWISIAQVRSSTASLRAQVLDPQTPQHVVQPPG